MDDRSGAADTGRAAMAAVREGRREAWLALFSSDTRVEDPVGHLPAIEGREALAQFWDAGIAPLKSVEFDVTRTWEAGAEAMLLATVTVVAANDVKVSYDGTFNYAIDADGRIGSLRAFWDLPAVAAAFAV
ncbi:MAG TPA: nuclear transport factor 2 family protein [Solirubrobacterales bacterium]|nr:nuclear transport factor 2 family protein [Solirubrobacterales bacterium]